MGGFCLLVEMQREGSAPAVCAAVLFIYFLCRPGDWKCKECENVNFAWRDKCNKCEEPKVER